MSVTHIIYSEVDVACIIILILIWNRVVSTEYKETVQKRFIRLLVFSVAFCVVDALWGVFSSHTLWWGNAVLYIFTYGFHGMAALAAFVWSGYVLYYADERYERSKAFQTGRWILLLAQWIMLAFNIVTKHVFCVDAAGIYVTGPLRRMLFVLQFASYVIGTIYFGILALTAADRQIKSRMSTVCVFSFVPLLTGIFQFLAPDAPFYAIGFMLASFTIYAFNLTQEREDYLAKVKSAEATHRSSAVIEALTEEYTSIYYIDLKTESVSAFRSSDKDKRQFGDFLIKNAAYTQIYNAYVNDTVLEEDREEMLQFGSIENLRRELQNNRFIAKLYRSTLNGTSEIFEIKIVNADETAEQPTEAILAIANRDRYLREEREHQEALEAARNAAEAASAAKTDFLSHMSHDIRTPINGVIGMTEIAQKHLDDTAKVEDCLGKIDTASHHLLSLINDVLDMSRIESGKTQITNDPMNLQVFADNCVSIISGQLIDREVRFIPDFSGITHANVFGDELHLRQILLNILGNAVKFTPNGGEIRFSIGETPVDENESEFCFTVADTGIGMKPEFLAHIWEAFSQENSSSRTTYKGTGLGMAISKQYVELMNGTIDVDSTPGEGSTFTVCLHMQLNRAAAKEADERIDSAIRGARILLAEDNELNREIAEELLSDEGVQVTSAENGRIAVEIFSKAPAGSFDAILMDIMMPEMDGLEATRAIRALPHPDAVTIPIIAMTANAFDEDVSRTREAGMNAHLSKPIEVAVMFKTLAYYIHRGRERNITE